MSLLSAGEIAALKRDYPCHQVAGQWVALRPGSGKFGPSGFTGPCPLHSPNPQARDSTRFEVGAEGWVCVDCGGGDVFRLVALRHGLDPEKDFRQAVELLAGRRRPSAEEIAAAERAPRETPIESEQARNEWRDAERRKAYDIYYKYGLPLRDPAAAPGRRYLREIRKVDFPDNVWLRFDPACRFYVPDRPRARLVHSGPALLGQIQRAGHFIGAHMTFLDLAQPKGKARIVDPKTGALQPAKKVRGSMKGGHVELVHVDAPRALVLGEGKEKVLAVWTALHEGGRDLTATAFWSAMNLGNLGGKHAGLLPHPTLKTESGRVRRVPGSLPDLTAPAIEIPPSVSRLVLLGDSTSDRFSTQCVLARAAKRYARPGLEVVAAWAPDGQDFDDLLRLAAPER
ncbi:MAG TPA: hypothetical protein VIH40_14475, partial [Xanthobacteraceae bacterium]